MLLIFELYVAILALDFTIYHATLATKLATLDIPKTIFNWLINFLKH